MADFIYSVVAGLDITFSTGTVALVVPVPLDTAFDIPNILFSVFCKQVLCSSYEAFTNSSMWSTISPKKVVDSDFFLRHEDEACSAAAAAAGATSSDFTACADSSG